jgi:hypothetical protein
MERVSLVAALPLAARSPAGPSLIRYMLVRSLTSDG